MALDHYSTPAPAPITFSADPVEFETLVRVLVGNASASRLKKTLDWMYGPGRVVPPARRSDAPSNVVNLGRVRALRRLKADYGLVGEAAEMELSSWDRGRRALFTPFAIQIEAHLAMLERFAARKAAKARKSGKGKK